MCYRKYKRKENAELRPVTEEEIKDGVNFRISVSEEDVLAGSPKIGDMIARNPKNNKDMWLVAKQYFEDNFEGIK